MLKTLIKKKVPNKASYPSAYANIRAKKYCKGKVGRNKKGGGGKCKVATKGKGIEYGKNS